MRTRSQPANHSGERTLRASRSGRWHRLAISLGFVLLLLPFDRAARINGLGRLCLAVLLPHFLDPLPGHLVEGVILHWLDQELSQRPHQRIDAVWGVACPRSKSVVKAHIWSS